MPKPERGTPKDIANRIKAKGLQKLKFYCQMCSKQCRDENGFKCHLTSDSHLRQMRIFSENSSSMLDKFSNEFERMYLETLRRRHGTKQMNANNVYQEVIQDKHHIHMNSTKWTCLSDFVQYLGKMGKCVVEETERGWYVTYISRDPILMARREAAQRKVEAEKIQEERVRKRMEIQRKEAAKELDRIGGNFHVEASNLDRKNREGGGKLQLDLGLLSSSGNMNKVSKKRKLVSKSVFDMADSDSEYDDVNQNLNNRKTHTNGETPIKMHVDKTIEQKSTIKKPAKSSTTNLSYNNVHLNVAKKLIDQKYTNNPNISKPKQETQKSKNNNSSKRKPYWLYEGIYVRIISKTLSNGEYYKRKAIVVKIIPNNKYAAEVEIISSNPNVNDGGDIIQIDQDDLDTVIPKKLGKKCRIVNGEGRGCLATLIQLDDKKCRAVLKILGNKERIIEKVDYDDFSKAE